MVIASGARRPLGVTDLNRWNSIKCDWNYDDDDCDVDNVVEQARSCCKDPHRFVGLENYLH